MLLPNVGSFFSNIHGWAFIRGSIFGGNFIKKMAFFVVQTGEWAIGPLLDHGPKEEILRYNIAL